VPVKQETLLTDAASAPELTLTCAGGGRTIAWLARELACGLDAVELSPPQYRILILLSDGSTMSSALASRLAVSPPSVSSVVDGLVNRGLVERRHGEDDRRRVPLQLTEEGREILAQADRHVDARLAGLVANLGAADLARRAIDDLELWSDALVARRQAKAESRGQGSQP
jgi:long-chain acyl-CoA synthetase